MDRDLLGYRMITDLLTLKEVHWYLVTVVSCQMYALKDHTDTCFLKCGDNGRVMKSDIVEPPAPDAVPYNWLLK